MSILPYRLSLNGIVKRGAFYSKHALVIVHSKTAMYSLLLMLHYDLVSTRHVEEISISTLDNWIGHFISWQRHVRCERSVGNQEITMNRIESQEIVSFSDCCLEKENASICSFFKPKHHYRVIFFTKSRCSVKYSCLLKRDED